MRLGAVFQRACQAKQLCGQRGALALDYEAQLHLSELKAEELQKSCSHQMQELSMQRQLASSLQLQLEDEERKNQTSSQIHLEVQAKDLEIQSLRAEVSALAHHDAASNNEELAQAEAAACQVLRAEVAAEQDKVRQAHEVLQTVAGGPPQSAAARAVSAAERCKIFEAAAQGDAALALALGGRPPPEITQLRSEDGSTLLHAAAAGGSLLTALGALRSAGVPRQYEHDLQRELLRHEHLSFVNARDCEQRSALLCHCQSAVTSTQSVAALLELQANPSFEDGHGCTPFLACATRGNCEVMMLLLRATGGAVLRDSDENGWTALHSAASKGHADAVQLLLQVSADAELPDAAGRRAADLARCEDVLKLLTQQDEVETTAAGQSQPRMPRQEKEEEAVECRQEETDPETRNLAPTSPTSPSSPGKYTEACLPQCHIKITPFRSPAMSGSGSPVPRLAKPHRKPSDDGCMRWDSDRSDQRHVLTTQAVEDHLTSQEVDGQVEAQPNGGCSKSWVKLELGLQQKPRMFLQSMLQQQQVMLSQQPELLKQVAAQKEQAAANREQAAQNREQAAQNKRMFELMQSEQEAANKEQAAANKEQAVKHEDLEICTEDHGSLRQVAVGQDEDNVEAEVREKQCMAAVSETQLDGRAGTGQACNDTEKVGFTYLVTLRDPDGVPLLLKAGKASCPLKDNPRFALSNINNRYMRSCAMFREGCSWDLEAVLLDGSDVWAHRWTRQGSSGFWEVYLLQAQGDLTSLRQQASTMSYKDLSRIVASRRHSFLNAAPGFFKSSSDSNALESKGSDKRLQQYSYGFCRRAGAATAAAAA
ncbi:unnamed protein product [Symbiodinium sp. KB8]|nr:unnamed protein product [Symbiodinium sp. KB8]